MSEASADKMMVKARGGKVWHKKDKEAGRVPAGLTGLDKEATWSYSKADGWLYGHGTFCLTSHGKSVVGLFIWMLNSASESKRLGEEIPAFANLLETVCMDSKADDEKMYSDLKDKYGIKLLTVPRKEMDKSERRQKMIAEQMKKENRLIYKQRGVTVEPMQGLIKDLFGLEDCWMRGNRSNRWLFAAMGIAVQIAQHQADKKGKSTWRIKEAVCGL
jgi:hypothetical protein